jgi:transketolase
MTSEAIIKQAADTIRLLAADAVQKANSGHPGMPMGCADYALTLWAKYMRHDPANPNWLGRDRFVLSAGHGSTLLYSLLHLFGYDLPIEELKQFRQWGSLTPGHPEFGHTPGVEVTTGPLATGLSTAVGLAMAAKQLAAKMGNEELFNQRIFVMNGDGCMMEGVSHEAASLAGHQKLNNLVCFYDSNSITIEGSTSLAFSEDVARRFEAYGWNVIKIDGQNVVEIEKALDQATADSDAPTMIIGTTTIGFGSPGKAGSASSHGAPLGDEELAATKAALGFPADESFVVPDKVREVCAARKLELGATAAKWNAQLEAFLTANADKATLLKQLTERTVPANILEELLAAVPEKDLASRASGGIIMQRAAALVPALCGGSADLNPSTNTYLKEGGDFCPENRAGRNFHFGVREFAMGLAGNGLALYGTAIPFTSTFAVFSDFMKPAMRLAAIQKLREVYVLTHDSIFVGEDGPTHQPIEQLMMMRSIPDFTVIRPAESHEVAHAWAYALQADGPVALMLTRQTLKNFEPEMAARIDVARGAYVLSEDEGFDMIIMATGSEVNPSLEAAEILRQQGQKVRVVSMPSLDIFEAQDKAYRDSILPASCTKRVSVEAGVTLGWDRYVGCDGLKIGVDHFGHSAPFKLLAEKYGLVANGIVDAIGKHFA